MKHLKRLLAVGLVLSLGFSTSVFAQEMPEQEEIVIFEFDGEDLQDDMSLRYTLIHSMGIGLTIEDRVAYVYAECKSYDNATITIKAELQRDDGSWNTIKTYNASDSNTKSCSLSESYAVTRNYQYRVKLTATVKVGSASESDIKYGTVQTAYSVPWVEESEALEDETA